MKVTKVTLFRSKFLVYITAGTSDAIFKGFSQLKCLASSNTLVF